MMRHLPIDISQAPILLCQPAGPALSNTSQKGQVQIVIDTEGLHLNLKHAFHNVKYNVQISNYLLRATLFENIK